MNRRSLIILLSVCFSSLAASAQTVPAGSLRAGAAKIVITPSEAQRPKQFVGVLDDIDVRTIVIDNGVTRAALVSLDLIVVTDELANDVRKRAETELGIPADHLLITAVHTHSAPMLGPAGYEDQVIASIREAEKKLQPAVMSYGTGVSYLNVQRDQIDPATHLWGEGANYSGLSDKTVAVLRFDTPAGQPIAVYYNYAMHAVITGTLDLISGDIPGATSRYIETALGHDAVALWSEGAAGDQNPIYFQQTYDLRRIRTDDYAKRGIDIRNALPPGGQGLDRNDPETAKLMNEQKQMILSMGQLLGEEVLAVTRRKLPEANAVRILGKQTAVTCPGRERLNEGRAGIAGEYRPGPPVKIDVGVLMLDDVAIGWVDAEVYNEIAQRLKRESPYKKTMMATLTNGIAKSGYIPDDASFGHNTFEVLSSNLQPGCAETSIVDGIVQLMPKISY